MWHPIKHYKTIHHHKMLVMQGCFRCGLYWQGLTHDLSKLSPVEFWAGAKYWQGTCSPNNAQRKAEGYSAAWLHHKGRNKHHLEYWIDYAPNGDHAMAGMRMPNRYVAEMVCDRIAASKNYKGTSYTDAAAWEYYEHRGMRRAAEQSFADDGASILPERMFVYEMDLKDIEG